MSFAPRPLERPIVPGRRTDGALPLRQLETALTPLAAVLLLAGSGDLLWLGYAALLLGCLARGREGLARLAAGSPLDGGWALLLAGSLLGLVVSANAAAAAERMAAVMAALAVFVWLKERVRSERSLRRAAWALVSLCVLGGLIVLALINGQLPDNQISRRLGPLLGLFTVFPFISGDVLDVNSRFPIHQYGLAYLLLIIVPFLAGQAALGRSPAARLAAGAGGLFLAIVLAATETRGAILALAVAVALVAGFRSRWLWGLLPLGALGLYLLLARGILSRSIEVDWLNTRLSIWSRSLDLLADYPFTGAGLGMRTFAEVFAWTYRLSDPYQVVHSHNIFIQAYAEQGLLGLIGLLLLLGGGLLLALRAALGISGPARPVAAGALGALVGTLLYGLTDQVPMTNYGLAIVAALLALAVAGELLAHPAQGRSKRAGREDSFPEGAGVRPLRHSGLIVLAAAILLLVPLTPRWVSGLALNAAAAQLAAVVLTPGLGLEQKGAKLGQAESWLRQAIRWNPLNSPAFRVLARVRLQRHDVGGALAAVQGAEATGNVNHYERSQLGQLYYELGFWPQALDLWQAAGQVELLRQAATELAAKNDPKGAAAAHAALIELQPDEPEHYSNLAKAILAGPTPSVEEAVGWFERAAELNPAARRSLATQLVLQGEPYRINERRGGGRFELAVFWFELASRIDPSYDKPLVELGSTYYRTGLALADAGRAAEARARFEEAARRFRAAATLAPQNSSTWHQLGEAEEAADRLPDAAAAFERAVELSPRRGALRASLGRIYIRVGRCDAAGRELNQALALPDENGSHGRAQAELARLDTCR